MKAAARPIVPIVSAVMALLSTASGCKTSGSSATKDLPTSEIGQMSLQQWVDACQKELANPTTGAKSRADLLKLANTSDCAAAYPIIKTIFDHYSTKS